MSAAAAFHTTDRSAIFSRVCISYQILVNAFDLTDVKSPLEERMREAMRRAGVAITVTSLTSVISLAVSSAGFVVSATEPTEPQQFYPPLPSHCTHYSFSKSAPGWTPHSTLAGPSSFAVYLSLAVMFDFIFTLTILPCLLVLDERRQEVSAPIASPS